MPTIQVDDDVFAALQKRAIPFVDTPNSTLRRVLEVDGGCSKAAVEHKDPAEDFDALLEEANTRRRSKAPKADLKELSRAGAIRNGEKLYLVDYRGARVPHGEAALSNGFLEFKGKHYSMSDLARELLKKVGFESDSVRGPAHWTNAKGRSVMELWQHHLGRETTKVDD